MSSTNPYATWIRPEGELLQQIQTDIKKISTRFHTPYLHSHIDIAPAVSMPLTQLITQLRPVVHNHPPLEIELCSLDYSSYEHWMYLYFLVKPTPQLTQLRRTATKALNKDLAPYTPHVSIMYGDDPIDADKEKIIQDLSPKYIHQTFTINKLQIFEITDNPTLWNQVAEIPFS